MHNIAQNCIKVGIDKLNDDEKARFAINMTQQPTFLRIVKT